MFRNIQRGGLTLWPKLFNNLRSSSQTAFEEQFPSHVVCAWLGNSERIAREHSLQVTDAHFERAIQSGAQGSREKTEGSEGKARDSEMQKAAGNSGFLGNRA